MTREAQHKELNIRVKAPGGAPAEADIELINSQFAVDEQRAEDLMVREFLLAHNAIDRDGDIFDKAVLEDFAATLPGKGLFIKHPMSMDGDTAPGEGLFFRAEVQEYTHAKAREVLGEPGLRWAENDSKAYVLHAWAYVVRTAENESLLKKIGAGVARFVSIGFTAADREPIRDGDGNVIAQRILPPAEAYEGSLVWLGAQRGARAWKQAHIFDEPESEGGDMKIEEQLKQAETKLEGLQNQITKALGADSVKDAFKALEKLQDDAKALKALRDGLGDQAEILGDPDALKARLAEAEEYKGALADEVIRAERVKGALDDDTEDGVKAAREGFMEMPVAKLKRYRDNAVRGLTEEQIAGGDPNATGADKGERGKRDQEHREAEGKEGGVPELLTA